MVLWPNSPAVVVVCPKGKGGSMHMFSKEKHFYGGHGIVGAQVSLGTCLAFANHYRGNGNVSARPISVTALPTRVRFTRASTWQLCGNSRSIYIVENNRYAMGTSVLPVQRHSP